MFSQFTRIAFRSREKEMWTIDRAFSFIMPLFISVKYEMNTVVTITITSEMSRCLILCFTRCRVSLSHTQSCLPINTSIKLSNKVW